MKRKNVEPWLLLRADRFRVGRVGVHGDDAALVRGGTIVAIGRGRRLRREAPAGTRVVTLGGCTLTAGLVDSHTHFLYAALQVGLVTNLSAVTTFAGVLSEIHAAAQTQRDFDWVLASGFDPNRCGVPFPTAQEMDCVVADRPVLVRTRDWHSAWLNTAAMRAAGISARTPDPPGGQYVRDAHGRPSGFVQENAVGQLPDPLRELAQRRDAKAMRALDRALAAAVRATHAQGFVGYHTMDDAASLWHVQRQASAGTLGLRVVHAVPLREFEHAERLGLRHGLGDDWLRLGGVKMFADGALGSQTAYMFRPYPGRGEYCGVPVVAGEELKAAVRRVTAAGWPAWIHAIGDRAVHEAVEAIAAVRDLPPLPSPHRIEHAQCVRAADVRRMGRLGIVASVQPCHLPGDIATANRHWPRARRDAYPFRRLMEAGVVLAGGSDVPIEPLDVRPSLYGAVCRTDREGQPAGGWFPQQRLTVAETLDAFTVGAARAAGRPAGWGTLTPGAPADFTVWEDDPYAAPAEALRELRIAGCVIDGVVHVGT